jgi:hypothetical protein
MSKRALVPNVVHTLTRINPRTLFRERCEFVGDLKLKPKGWRVVPNSRKPAMSGTGAGLA